MNNNDNAEMEFHVPVQGKDLNDLADVSAENADEGEIKEDIPTNPKCNKIGSQGDPNHESESQGNDAKEETSKCNNKKMKSYVKRKCENETQQQ